VRAPFAAIVLSTAVASTAFADDQDFDRIERGRYLAVVGDCAACHTDRADGLLPAGWRCERHLERW
jgi:mono/diheme cytochrome c family protein